MIMISRCALTLVIGRLKLRRTDLSYLNPEPQPLLIDCRLCFDNLDILYLSDF